MPAGAFIRSLATAPRNSPDGHQSVLFQRQQEAIQRAETIAQNRLLDINLLKSKIRELEAEVLEEQRAKQAATDRAARMQQLLEEARTQAELSRKALEDLQRNTNLRLTWDNIMQEGSVWNTAILELTGIVDAKVLAALYEWVNWNGQARRLRYWHGEQTIRRIKAVIAGTTKRKSVGRSLKGVSPEDALLVTLVKLRTGLGTRVISAWSGIPYSKHVRIFVT